MSRPSRWTADGVSFTHQLPRSRRLLAAPVSAPDAEPMGVAWKVGPAAAQGGQGAEGAKAVTSASAFEAGSHSHSFL